MVIDQVSDKNKSFLFQLDNLVQIPEFVKEAALTTADDLTELPSTAFADPVSRQFPIHTKAEAWLSREYFDKFAKNSMDPTQATFIENSLKVACEFWDNGETAAPVLTKEAADEGTLIEYRVGDETKASVRVRNEADMHKVARDLEDNRNLYPWAMRRDVARQLLAAGYEPDFEEKVALEKTAAYGTGTLDNAVDAVHRRIGACRYRHQQMVKPLETLLENLNKVARKGLLSPDMLDKASGFIDAVDRFSDLHKHYPAPESELFSITLTQMDALDKHAVRLPSGQLVTREAVEDFDTRRFLRDTLGIQSTQDNVVEKVASLSAHRSQLIYEFLTA